MTKTFFKNSILLPIIAIVVFVSTVSSLTYTTSAEPVIGFNPGRIIDDGVMADANTMTPGNIQYFLDTKGVSCRDGEAPCLKNFNEGGRSAAQIIFDAGQEFQINPQVLIATLQKEVGLVTVSQPGSWRYRTAMGYGCPDSTPGVCNNQYYGFTNQIRWAARMFHAIMIASPTWYTPYTVGNNFIQWSPDGNCGGTNVYIQNRATQALYNYTPYQPNQAALNAGYGTGDGCSAYGNRNFFLYFRDWFGNPQMSAVVRAPSDPAYYLLTNNKRYGIANGDILYAYGLNNAPVSVVSDAYLASIPNGGMLNTIYTVPGDNTVFFADGGKKYGIPSGEYCIRWGLACGNTNIQKVIGPEIANLLGNGGTIQPIMRFQNHYYLMVNGKKQHFLTPAALFERGWTLNASIPIVNWTNATRAEDISLAQNNSFIKYGASGTIYLFSNNQFFSIPNIETLNNWAGPNPVSNHDNNSSYVNTPPTTSGQLSNLIVSNGTTTLVGYDKLYNLTGAQPTVTPQNIDNHPSLRAFLSQKQNLTIDSTKALGVANGTIFALQNNILRPIPTMTDLRMSYSDANIIKMPTSLLDVYPIGKLYMIPGRVFRPSDSSGAMYIYGGDKNLWALGSLTELYPSLKWNSDIVQTPFSNIDFSNINIYANLAKINNVPYIVLPDGSLKTIPTAAIASHARIMPLDGDMVKTLAIDNTAIRFIRFDNGTIFRVDTTEIRPINSMSTYNSLGGNASNTASVSVKAVDTFKVGSPL